MAMFNSYVKLPEGNSHESHGVEKKGLDLRFQSPNIQGFGRTLEPGTGDHQVPRSRGISY